VVTRFDSLLAVPRVDADEQARRLLITLSSRCQLPDGLIVQASRRYHSMIKRPLNPSWLDTARLSRERFGYPPAWKLFLLRQRTQARHHGISSSALVRQLRRIDSEIFVTDPQLAPGRSSVDRAGTSVLVRTRRTIPPELQRVLANLDESWTITVDPLDLR
jgi:primosomal protein N'